MKRRRPSTTPVSFPTARRWSLRRARLTSRRTCSRYRFGKCSMTSLISVRSYQRSSTRHEEYWVTRSR